MKWNQMTYTSLDSSVNDPPSPMIDPVSVKGIEKASAWFANCQQMVVV